MVSGCNVVSRSRLKEWHRRSTAAREYRNFTLMASNHNLQVARDPTTWLREAALVLGLKAIGWLHDSSDSLHSDAGSLGVDGLPIWCYIGARSYLPAVFYSLRGGRRLCPVTAPLRCSSGVNGRPWQAATSAYLSCIVSYGCSPWRGNFQTKLEGRHGSRGRTRVEDNSDR